jgi:murein DD-endopeptidase MepM/ murein hydrolase activator NlpD
MNLVFLLALAAAVALLRTVSAQAPVITPSDISTPTPLMLPTPTQPPATQPLADPVSPPSHPAARSIHALDATPITYTVRPGDTLFTVALEMGLDLDDAPCAVRADFTVDQPLVIGDVLSAPPANVVCHEVQPGETLESIAAAYFVDPGQIRALVWNRLTGQPDRPLTAYTHLRVPLAALTSGQPASNPDLSFLLTMLNMPVNTSPFVVFAQKSAARTQDSVTVGPVPADWPYGSGRFTWPVYGWLSQNYRFDHRAVDIAAPQGTPVTASDRGVVLRAGWNNQGYGRFVIIDHTIDYVTLYAHLDRVLVKEGEIVGQGQVIGTVGSTGNSTGPHLHFEIRDFGRLTNPLELLTAP